MVLVNVQACMLLFPRGCVCFKCYNTRCGCAFLLGAFLWLGPRFPLTFPNYALKPSARPETLYVEDLWTPNRHQLLAVASNPWETERVFQHLRRYFDRITRFSFSRSAAGNNKSSTGAEGRSCSSYFSFFSFTDAVNTMYELIKPPISGNTLQNIWHQSHRHINWHDKLNLSLRCGQSTAAVRLLQYVAATWKIVCVSSVSIKSKHAQIII